MAYHVQARLWLGDSSREAAPIDVYTLDMNPYAIAFLTPRALAPGAAVLIEFKNEQGQPHEMKFSVYRCRQFRDGWFEAVVTRRK